MKPLSPRKLAVLLPVTLLAHQLEEYYFGFPVWYSRLLNACLSESDFIWINAIGLLVIGTLALSYFLHRNNVILVALGTLVIVNGLAHLLLSLFTFSYSPGTLTGLVFFLPLGLAILMHVMPQLPKGDKVLAVALGVVSLLLVGLVARWV